MPTIPEEEYLAQQGVLAHYGTPRHSGRYPWGSGDDETTSRRNATLLTQADEWKRQGMSEKDIATGLNLTTTQLRDIRTVHRNELRQDQIHMAQRLADKGLSNGAIAARMQQAGYKVNGESQVRALLQPGQERKTAIQDEVADKLRQAVTDKKMIDVGAGMEFQLDISSTKLRSVLQKLQDEGYRVHPDIKVPQLGTQNKTNLKVLTGPDLEWGDVQKNFTQIKQLTDYSDDGGFSVLNVHPPLAISSSRVGIRYAEQGGTDADGVMYVRPGKPDLSMGGNRYSQVRVLVDGSHYLKGMAIYKDDLPAGTDILFNTNKSDTGNKLDALKKIKDDPDNPFGATVRQIGETAIDPKTGKMRLTSVTSVMNLVNGEGDWDRWSKSLSSQFLSKQKPALAKEQLDKTRKSKEDELKDILALNNPSVKKKLLDAYADGVDSSAVHLKAAALPRQKTQVILPVNEMKEHEIYAPNFDDGERVALVRFPHGGTFEIPELTVNNRNPAAKKLLGDSRDAIGIHSKVAERLSGADFDGDNVLVIPNSQGKVKSTPALEGLKNFDPKSSYPHYEGMKVMTAREKGMQMGLVSNLITDMTIQGASTDELARAVRHSMVVIDAEKHSLDFRRSAQDNGISALMKKYQKSSQGGASTLISKATSPIKVPERKERSAAQGGPVDPITGKRVYTPTNKSSTWTDEAGKTHVHPKTTTSVKLAETDNAHTLSSGTVIEKIYGDHSNALKALANKARKESHAIKTNPYSKSARKAFEPEVNTLNSKLALALRNAPLERQAQVFANATVKLKVQADPNLKLPDNKAEYKRVKSQALAAARARTGADKQTFEITDDEWSAIQAGAITAHKLDEILKYANLDRIKELATPRDIVKLTSSNVSRAKSMHARGYTWAEVARALGTSVSTIKDAVDGKGD